MSLRDQAKQLSYAENLANSEPQFSEKDRDYQNSGGMQNILGQLPVMWMLVNTDSGRILHANSELCEKLHITPSEFQTMKFEHVFAPQCHKLLVDFRERLTTQNRISCQEVMLNGNHHISLRVSMNAGLVFDDYGQASTFSVVFHPLPQVDSRRDVDQLSRKLQRSNEDLEQFAYITSHDLQEPLRMVTSYLQLLEKRAAFKLNETDLEFLNFAVDGAIRMKGLLDGILEYSRINTRGNAFEEVALEEILDQVKVNLRKAIIETETEIEYGSLPQIYADRAQITRLLQNLIGNSIKFSGQKSPRIEITFSESLTHYQFRFRDYGIGIGQEYLERIFLIFQRLNHRTAYPGNGIGLAICRGIVRRHGGRIWAESHEDEGTSFCFTLGKKEP
jgi:chemotaxis family two-component system sensor kinase Cph1